MNNNNLIERYKASNISVPMSMIGWMRSNHAGETGAVWIYIGSRCVFWNKDIKKMSREHYQTEKNHLIIMNHLLKNQNKSKLLLIWRVLGFSLGFFSAVFGYRFFCVTIQAVETFVEKHYQEQIEYLYTHSISYDLLKVLEICCEEEVEHQNDAELKKGKINNYIENFWSRIVGSGSSLAVSISKLI
jgi:ubiquinone biosynthesis monooxygenase Coq7